MTQRHGGLIHAVQQLYKKTSAEVNWNAHALLGLDRKEQRGRCSALVTCDLNLRGYFSAIWLLGILIARVSLACWC